MKKEDLLYSFDVKLLLVQVLAIIILLAIGVFIYKLIRKPK